MTGVEQSRIFWRKSTASVTGECIEVALVTGEEYSFAIQRIRPGLLSPIRAKIGRTSLIIASTAVCSISASLKAWAW